MTREEAIRILASSCIPGSKQTEALETIIPELAESEDERIKKIITDSVFYQYGAGVEYKDVLDYLDKLEKQKDLTTENIYKHSRERMSFWNGQQKEQKPAESISQLTVQGKGVYKICPRCKERMVRDDSMVYTSMPPQYRYECPKCGESECDTVMYDNPKMEEQKPAEKHDLVAQLKEHLANTPKEQLEAEWKELEKWNHIGPTVEEYFHRIKPAEWSEEDELMMKAIIGILDENDHPKLCSWLKSLRPSWKPNDEDEVRLINTSISFLKDFADKGYENAVECIDWLKSKLNGNTGE